MKIYNYHPDTNEFINESIADESPLEDSVYLLPAFATFVKPPEINKNEVAIFKNKNWITKPDFRGQTVFNKTNLSPFVITEIGDISENYFLTLPKKPNEFYDWDGQEYIFNVEKKFQEILAKEIESYKIQNKFLNKFVFDYTDDTKEAMEKAILSLSQPNAEPIKIMDKATEFNYIALPEAEQIFSQIVQRRTDLHNQCIAFLEKVKAGNVDIEIIFKINEV